MAYTLTKKSPVKVQTFAALAALAIGASALAWPVVAKARENAFAVVGSTTHVLDTVDSREEYRLDQYLNERGQKEIAVYHEEFRLFLDTEAIVMYGRDLDRDGQFDAWFIMGKGGVVRAVDQVAHEGDGWDVVAPLIRKNPGAMKNRWLVGALLHWMNGYAGFIGRDYFDQLDRTQMNLHSAEIRADRIARVNRSHPMLTSYYQQISIEWNRLGEEAEKKLVGTIVWDAAITIGPYYVGKAVTAILARLGIDLAGMPIVSFFQKLYGNLVKAIGDTTKAGSARMAAKIKLNPKSRAKINMVTGPLKIAATRAGARVDRLLAIMEAHDALSRTLAHSFRRAMDLGRAGMSQWTYILQTQGVQLGAEVFSRRDELWSPNPIVLSKRIASDKDLLQNLSFMTSETFMLAGMSKLQPNIPKRLVLCAAMAVVNTVASSYLVKGESDFERVKLDAKWEAVVGNGQTLIDTTAIGVTAHMAEKSGNAKLALVGYAVAFVDQAVGYYSYAKVTQRLENKKKAAAAKDNTPPVRFIPIVAPI